MTVSRRDGRVARAVRARPVAGAVGVVAAVALCGCTTDPAQTAGPAQSSDPNLCASLDALSDQIEQLGASVPSDAPTGEPAVGVREQVADVEAALRRVEAAGEGTLDSPAAAMQEALTAFGDELASGTEAGRAAAEQSLDEVRQGWESLTQAADARCGSGASPS
jgi:hypothetical protein